jgi:heme exporter protein D
MSGWLAMGGYAAFVWPAYGLALAALAGLFLATRRTLKAREREFERLKRERP